MVTKLLPTAMFHTNSSLHNVHMQHFVRPDQMHLQQSAGHEQPLMVLQVTSDTKMAYKKES